MNLRLLVDLAETGNQCSVGMITLMSETLGRLQLADRPEKFCFWSKVSLCFYRPLRSIYIHVTLIRVSSGAASV